MQVKSLFRFAHISDLHFSRVFFGPTQFLSKRWVGNLNLILNRKKEFAHDQLATLIPLFQELKVDAVLVTGDLTTTAHKSEFQMAKKFIHSLEEAGLKVFLIPGNHDHYTREAYQNGDFYRHFDSLLLSDDPQSFFKLKDDRVSATHLGKEWWLLSVDSAQATSLFSSHGVFTEEAERNLEHALSFITLNQKVILLNHFPFFETENKKDLHRAEQLKDLLQRFSHVKLYLHGHTHRNIIADLRPSRLPIVLDSGCVAKKQDGTWNLIDITDMGCDVSLYQVSEKLDSHKWELQSLSTFMW